MKTIKTGILVFFLGSIVISCQNGDKKENLISGKWTIENITPDDSTDHQGILLLTLIMAMDGVEHLEFSSTGQYQVLNENDSVLMSSEYKISENGDELIIKEDGKEKTMEILSQSKSELKLKSNDGITLTLKK